MGIAAALNQDSIDLLILFFTRVRTMEHNPSSSLEYDGTRKVGCAFAADGGHNLAQPHEPVLHHYGY